MPRKKLEIKTGRKLKSKPVAIKKRKQKKKKYQRVCGFCKNYWHSPRVVRAEGATECRMCLTCKWVVKSETKCYCDNYDGRWVTIGKKNMDMVRDVHSPVVLQIKRRRKRSAVKIKKRRH